VFGRPHTLVTLTEEAATEMDHGCHLVQGQMTSVLELYRTNDHHRKIQTLLSKKDEETRINIIAKHGA
jgi:riboflavin synthase alpha subunit